MTIHITPEREFSYVSFESNVAASSYSELITRVIDTFKPGKFVVTVFANKTSPAFGASRELEHIANIGQFKRRDVQYCRFDAYDLTYAHYIKYPSWGLEFRPRVGANNTISFPINSSSKTPFFPSSTEDTTKIPFGKLLIKLLHFFTLFTPFENEKAIQEKQKRPSLKDENEKLNILPPFAYTTFLIFIFQLFSVIFVLNIEEFSSPLVMFSYWRNKISWNWLIMVLKI